MDIQDKYIIEHSFRQNEALNWVEKQTNLRTNHSRMLSGAVQGRLLTLIAEMIGPSKILELGTFTGYSAICLAGGMNQDGHLDTLEINDELEDLIMEGFERSGYGDRISLHIGDCKKTLARLKEEGAMYDLVYIDANKREYCTYYNLIFDMVNQGGWILADNVLWDGKVFQNPIPEDKQTQEIARFNDMIASDPRVKSVILPLRDGLNLIHKL